MMGSGEPFDQRVPERRVGFELFDLVRVDAIAQVASNHANDDTSSRREVRGGINALLCLTVAITGWPRLIIHL